MKKIFIAAFAAAFAACVHAAAFQWSSTGTIYAKGSDTVALSGFTAYLFDTSTVGQAALLEGIRGGKSITDYTSLSSFTGSTKVDTTAFSADLANGTMLNAFFAIVSDNDIYISKVAGKAAQSVGTASIAFGNQATASKSVFGDAAFASPGWYTTAVPEPTSGLLMLLGIAGLALKRKRA